jgi:hypothetical protein
MAGRPGSAVITGDAIRVRHSDQDVIKGRHSLLKR